MEQSPILVQMALKAWNIQLSRTDKFLDALPDESFEQEIAPGKNRVIYILGHLIAVNDGMLSLFGLAERRYAHFDEPFVRKPDKSGQPMPTPAQVREDWKRAHDALAAGFAQLSTADWFAKHTAMTEEDWVNDPGRNKLSVLINRTNHLAYHLGQLVLIH